jgi:hypothetical protein
MVCEMVRDIINGGIMQHTFRLTVILEEEVDGSKSEIMRTYSQPKSANAVHRRPDTSFLAMMNEAVADMLAMFKKSRTGGGR